MIKNHEISARLANYANWHNHVIEITNYLSWYPSRYLDGVVFAGGAVRNLLEGKDRVDNDVDIYIVNGQETVRNIIYTCLLESEFKEVSTTEWSYTFKKGDKTVQLMRKVYPSIQDLLDSFDYTVAQCAWSPATQDLYTGDWTMYDLGARQLRFNTFNNPSLSLGRLAKYVSYGYTPDKDTLEQLTKFIQQSRATVPMRHHRSVRKFYSY